jgi:hypothetical protein
LAFFILGIRFDQALALSNSKTLLLRETSAPLGAQAL